MAYRVKAPLVIVKDEDRKDQYLYEGATLPSYVKGDDLKRLQEEGLVEEVKAEEQPASQAIDSSKSSK